MKHKLIFLLSVKALHEYQKGGNYSFLSILVTQTDQKYYDYA